MTAAAASISMHENPVVKELLELLKTPGFHAERKDYKALIDGYWNQFNCDRSAVTIG